MADWLPWSLLAAAVLHITEEFLFPGGFPAWYRRYNADPSRVTRRFLLIINGGLLVACVNVGLLGHNKPTPSTAAAFRCITIAGNPLLAATVTGSADQPSSTRRPAGVISMRTISIVFPSAPIIAWSCVVTNPARTRAASIVREKPWASMNDSARPNALLASSSRARRALGLRRTLELRRRFRGGAGIQFPSGFS